MSAWRTTSAERSTSYSDNHLSP